MSKVRRISTLGATSGDSNATHDVPDFGGSRVTIASTGGGAVGDSIPRKARRELGLEGTQLNSMGVSDLLYTLADAHPDMSFALWNFNRMANSGYIINVVDVESGEVVQEGNEAIDDLIRRLDEPHPDQFQVSKSFDKVVSQLLQSVVLSGAAALEVVTTPGYDDVAFFAPVDPYTIEFTNQNGRLIPTQDDGEISLDIPTFFYEGLDELIDNPYGRSPVIGAINTIMFQLQVLQDLKAVVHNQGYPRFDITLMEDILLKRMPPVIRNNEEKKQKWLEEQMASVKSMFESLDPDDSFVHMDSVSIGMAGGKDNKGGAVVDPEKLMHVIDNQIMGGLKTLSTILGRRTTGNTESFAKIEVKLYTKGVEAMQDVVERVMRKALTLYLNMLGIQGVVQFDFKPVEIRTEIEIAQFEQIRIMNAITMRDEGWITQDEASLMITGKEAVSDPLRVSDDTDEEDSPQPTISSGDERGDGEVEDIDTTPDTEPETDE